MLRGLEHMTFGEFQKYCAGNRNEYGEIDYWSCIDCPWFSTCTEIRELDPCDWDSIAMWEG